jgi:hypothetical protein
MFNPFQPSIVRFMTRNPEVPLGARNDFSPLRDERPLERSFMRRNPGSANHEFRPLTDVRQISSSDFTFLEGQGGASEYVLNNIDEITSAELYAMVNEIIATLRIKTTLLHGKRVIKMYAVNRQPGITENVFYEYMTGAQPSVPLRTLVQPNRRVVILVELERVPEGVPEGGSKRKLRRKSRRNRKSRRR